MASNTEANSMVPIYNRMRGFIASDGVFSHDCKLLFLYSLKNIYIYSIETGECICSLYGHKSDIVSLIINPLNSFQLISLDKHGIINIYDYLRCKCINTIDLSSITKLKNINKNTIYYSSLIGSNNNKNIYCIVNNQHIISINITNKTIKPIITKVSTRKDVKGFPESFLNICLSSDGKFLSAILNREIIVIKTNNFHLISYKTHGWKLSKTVSFHPNNNLLAFSDARGCIHLWNDFISVFNSRKLSIQEWLNTKDKTNTKNKYLMSKIHWHAHVISSITFTTDGAYMLSGGEESVLVLTQLETQRQQYLPRLGGPISFISVSNDEIKFAIGLTSNKIRIIDAINNKVISTIDGIGICSKMKPYPINTCVKYPKNKNIYVMPSLPGTIQFYNLNKNISKGILTLCKYPIVSRIQNKYYDKYNAQIIKFNYNGTRLITILKRTTNSILGFENNNIDLDETENLVHLIILQIWHYNPKNDEFILNTRIDSPHGSNLIKDIQFHPQKNIFLTFAEKDNNFRLWEECYVTKNLKPNVNKINNINKTIHFNSMKHNQWKSLMTGYYNKDYVSSAQFSYDGTILFIAAGLNLTLWNSNNLMLLKKIEQVSIINSIQNFNELPFLLTVDNNNIMIWDLIQFKQHWSVNYELPMAKIFDVCIIPFKHKLKNISQALFLMVCTLKMTIENELEATNENIKYLILCDMENKLVINKWLLPEIEVTKGSMIIEAHNMNKQIIKMIDIDNDLDQSDIDVVFITNTGPVKIQCLYNQMKKDIDAMDVKDDENNDIDIVSKYLAKLTGNSNSVFEKIFGMKQLQSNPVSIDELERQKLMTKERLLKLRPETFNKLNVVEEMFSGPAHTFPPMDEIWDQFMGYFVEPVKDGSKLEKEKDEINQRRVGNSNVILDEIKDEEMNDGSDEDEDEDFVIVDGGKDDGKDVDEDDDNFVLTDNDLEHWKSLVQEALDIKSDLNVKSKVVRNGNHKECKGILSSFMDWRDGLNKIEQENDGGYDKMDINGSYD